MKCRRISSAGVAVGCVLAAHAGRADAPQSTTNSQQPTYPISVRLQVSSESLAKVFAYTQGDGITAPKNPSCTVAVGQQARDAYVKALSQAFRVAADDERANGDVEVSIAGADIEFRGGGWRAFAEHVILLRTSGTEIGRWKIRKDEPIVGVEESSLQRAFERAAEGAARKFVEADFENTAAVAAWMREHGVDFATVSAARNPPRTPYASYFDLGGGVVNGSDELLLARLGFAGPWYLAQMSFGRWSTLYAPSRQSGYSDVRADTTSMGIELGGRFRFARWELRAGGGPHLLWGHANQTYPVNTTLFPGNPVGQTSFPFTVVAPGFFAAIQYASGAGPYGARLRFGLEARGYVGTAVKFVEYGGESSIATTSLNLFIGVELPVGAGVSGARGAGR